MASVRRGFRKKEQMNLAEPSGSSPPEKPPGRTIIWALWMASSRAWADWERRSALRLRTTTISGSMPARRQARAVSYSQLVPGKTGMTALGRAVLWRHTAGEGSVQLRVGTSPAASVRVG